MKSASRARLDGPGRLARLAVLLALAGLISACSASKPVEKAEISNKTLHTVKDYGVPASPRVTDLKNVPKGGGRHQVGKPYKVKGKWYTPKEDPTYVAQGKASWYGPNFHGRLTANGEVYNQYALSAAHPTMPLPSYARVTNLRNNTSVIVRVNDRGPYAHGRVVDLSRKAAELLAFKDDGVTDVKVEYVGRARLEGSDEKFLLASFRGPGAQTIEPGATVPGSMIAMVEEPAPPAIVGSVIDQAEALLAEADIPVPTPRPAALGHGTPLLVAMAAPAPLSYAPDTASQRIASAFAAVDRDAAAERNYGMVYLREAIESTVVISLGVFADEAAIDLARTGFSDLGIISSRPVEGGWELTMLVGGDAADSALAIAKARGLAQARRLPADGR